MTKRKRLRIIIAGGGTGGHVFPALAIAEKIKQKKKSAEVIFIGTKRGLEGKVIPDKGYQFLPIWIGGLVRKNSLVTTAIRNVFLPVKLLTALIQSVVHMLRIKPDVVIGTGGFVSGPPLVVAALMGIPTAIHEQNSYPGLTTRMLAGRVNQVHISYEKCRGHLKKKLSDIKMSGNPIRPELVRRASTISKKAYGIEEDRRTLLIFGGSQGSRPINLHILEKLDIYLEWDDIQIIWQTGPADFKKIITTVGSRQNVKILPFLVDMAGAYTSSDLAICRAGAITLAELAIVGLPSILIPLPHAAERHQYHNAEMMAEAGAALVVRQEELSEGKLEEIAHKLLYDEKRLREMSDAGRQMASYDAAERIVDSVLELVD